MNKERILFNWLRQFRPDVFSYRLNHLPGGRGSFVPISLDDVNISTIAEYINGQRQRELTYVLQLNQPLKAAPGDVNANNAAVRDELAKWLCKQSLAGEYPSFEGCTAYEIDDEPELHLAYETEVGMARYQLIGRIYFIEDRAAACRL